MKIGFYILGKKGYSVLIEFVRKFEAHSVAFVVFAKDSAVDNDWSCDIFKFCEDNEIKCLERNPAGHYSLVESDYDFAIGWRWLIKDVSKLIVFHDSLLPKYRGFAPLVNMLIDGVNTIGVTALLASDEYDKGDVILQESKTIVYPIKISEAIDKIIPLYSSIVIRVANLISKKEPLKFRPQNEMLASYSLWRDEKDYFVQWCKDSKTIKRFVDAVGYPYKGAAALINGEIIRIFDVVLMPDVVVQNRDSNIGKVIYFHDENPVVVCGIGLIKLMDIRKNDGKTPISRIPFRSRLESIK